ncbi:glutamyl-tRNA(Gln) amidotransferase subunit A, mitochondrial-like [Mya arenaria]|uniref:glutamyl-tRNA(Gln) amidotransferase subunit A, mitochondrial-like n=1 Tax=Mya arenaria TaxID=6604 RepID=UPI0022E2D5B4|nr:glutamyl-tRNA(Gln) amidotransferase subunit A, mitochondrial-like [Mya arenaria]
MLSLTLREAVQQIKAGKISAKDLCEKCIERSSAVKELNAYVTNTHDVARQQLVKSENKPLKGVPVAIKDNFCTKNIRTTCSSHMLENYFPPYTATVVQRLFDNGAVMMGKTNMDEYAMGCGSIDSIHGPVRNPWRYRFRQKQADSTPEMRQEVTANKNEKTMHGTRNIHTSTGNQSVQEVKDMGEDDWFIAGGSSGGSAVAVATGTCFGALGSDTGGSVRNPASYCGVVGLKPSYGLVSRYGLIPLVNSLDVPGIFAKTVDDAALLLNTIAGHDVQDSTTVTDTFNPVSLEDEPSLQGLHIGIPKEYYAPGLCDETHQVWSEVADMLENNGAKVTQVSLPHTQYSITCYSVLCACEVASNMARYDGIEFGHRADNMESTEALYSQSRHEGFNDVVRGRIFAGNFFLLRKNYEQYFKKALQVRRLITEDFNKVYNSGVDVLLTPTTLTVAPQYSWFQKADNRTRTAEQDVFTQPVNMAGLPAVTLPVKLSASGLPISLQVIGQRFKDHRMLNVAKWIEMNSDFRRLDLSFLDNL